MNNTLIEYRIMERQEEYTLPLPVCLASQPSRTKTTNALHMGGQLEHEVRSIGRPMLLLVSGGMLGCSFRTIHSPATVF